MEEKEPRYVKMNFSLLDYQLDWLRQKGDEGWCISKIIRKAIDTMMERERLKQKEGDSMS